MFTAGFVTGVLVCWAWSYYQYKKRQKVINKIISNYDSLSMRYFTDYQNREESGVSIH